MSTLTHHESAVQEQANSFYAALARTAARGAALYFSRPVRLFRPSKVTGWHSLKALAQLHGTTLSPKYLTQLVDKQGVMVIVRHFVPPMILNTALGTVLWVSYSEALSFLEPRVGNASVPVSGAFAGGMQAIFAAPAENVRLVLEGGSKESWSHAWKEVFIGAEPPPSTDPAPRRKERWWREKKQVRAWMSDVGQMAGRGWEGWSWGFAKDACGFAAFFSVFEATRHVALKAKSASRTLTEDIPPDGKFSPVKQYLPRTVHGLTLVSGGVLAGLMYELSCRPWDVARKVVRIDRLSKSSSQSASLTLIRKWKEEGLLYFFHVGKHTAGTSTNSSRKLPVALRTLARVGPWGIGFLAWEAFGPGLS